MSKLTIAIPAYSATPELLGMLDKCIESYAHHAEVIVHEDADQLGFTKNANNVWKEAKGDYVAIVSSDTYLVSGDPNDLCIPGKVTSPHIENQGIDGLAGCFFVVPKEVAKERGYLNESMKTYYSDEDYKERTKDIFQKVPSVVIHHLQAQTVKVAGVEGRMDEDKAAYDKL